jgi:heme/copper-type cytochrome/quinol oxidase subunit 2
MKIDDGNWIEVTGTTSWSYDWNTTIESNGQYTIYARSYDGTDYSHEDSVDVVVSNVSPQSPEKSILEELWFWALIIAIIVVVMLLIFIMIRKKETP